MSWYVQGSSKLSSVGGNDNEDENDEMVELQVGVNIQCRIIFQTSDDLASC